MKCSRCGGRAEIKLRQHNASFCRDCFVPFLQRQVERSIEKHDMFTRDEEVLVAVSGGKDSFALWDILISLGYKTTGLHLSLGIGGYSDRSTEKAVAFAETRGLRMITLSLRDEGLAVDDATEFTKRPACSACGTLKRYYFDKLAYERGFPVVATGHNLDDEAARLLGNVLHWQMEYLGRQHPVLQPSHEKFVRKVKPLFRCGEYESAAYCFFRKIDYIIEECPNSVGATQLHHKKVLNQIEAVSPGSKLAFVQEFLDKAQPLLRDKAIEPPGTCASCGMPSHAEVCARCRLLREVESKRLARADRLRLQAIAAAELEPVGVAEPAISAASTSDQRDVDHT